MPVRDSLAFVDEDALQVALLERAQLDVLNRANRRARSPSVSSVSFEEGS